MELLRSLTLLYAALASFFFGAPQTRHYNFVIMEMNVTRLCRTRTILTVNGEYPGPTIYARKGDRIVVDVLNEGNKNISIHWHGLEMRRNPWYDGAAYVTQCPIRPGKSFTYEIQLAEEEGTLWWHAHTDYDRLTVFGAIAIRPQRWRRSRKTVRRPPLPEPDKEVPIMLVEWYTRDMKAVYDAIQLDTTTRPLSDANTINGQPGDLLPCSQNGTFKLQVEHGATYLLRLISASVDSGSFFAVAGHPLTVIAVDAKYVKPFTADYVAIYPGQTMDLLLTADKAIGRYYMAATAFEDTGFQGIDRTIATAIVEYRRQPRSRKASSPSSLPPRPAMPDLPDSFDREAGYAQMTQARSLDTPSHVPHKIDKQIIMTLSLNEVTPCPFGSRCVRPIVGANALNNVSFVMPATSISEAYYGNISGVYTRDFPENPPSPFDYTAENLPEELSLTARGTRVVVLDYNTSVEVVMQDTNLLEASDIHPMHFHGHNFYAVGFGEGIFDKEKDPLSYNLVDPPLLNTVGVRRRGWAAIRFRATNPGVWLMHCHYAAHLEWGMATVFIVKNGHGREASMLQPPATMPPC